MFLTAMCNLYFIGTKDYVKKSKVFNFRGQPQCVVV